MEKEIYFLFYEKGSWVIYFSLLANGGHYSFLDLRISGGMQFYCIFT